MPRDAANRFAEIAAALQLDRGRWIWLLMILLALDAVLGLGDSVSQLLRYDRSAIAAGGWWRLLTAHIVHLDVHHLVLNELGLVLMWSLFAQDYDAVEWCAIVSAGGRREAPCGALLGSLDPDHRPVREAGMGAMGRSEGALDRRRCASVRGLFRICHGGCTVRKDRYNSPPLSRLEA